MRKIPSLFMRNYDGDRLIRDEIVPGCEWVIAGEGTATRKYDGSACLFQDGTLYKRYDAKHGKTPPVDFVPAQEPDEVTGHWPGWIPVGAGPEDKWLRLALCNATVALSAPLLSGTYEAVGPHFQGNPEGFIVDSLMWHGGERYGDAPRDFEGLREFLRPLDIEGLVFHHPDGRMCKVKKKDFGMKRRES